MGWVALINFCATKALRTEVEDLTHPTIFTTAAPFTIMGRGCPHHPFHNFYSSADPPHPQCSHHIRQGFHCRRISTLPLRTSLNFLMKLLPLATMDDAGRRDRCLPPGPLQLDVLHVAPPEEYARECPTPHAHRWWLLRQTALNSAR